MGNKSWSCFDCRKTYNRKHNKCPHCGSELKFMGKYFKAPKRNKDKEWEAVELLIDAGAIYNQMDGKRPRHPRDVPEFLAKDHTQAWIRFWKSHDNSS